MAIVEQNINGEKRFVDTSPAAGGAIIASIFPSAGLGNRIAQDIVFAVTRTMTTATSIGVLPKNAKIISCRWYNPTASDAGTTATLSIGWGASTNELVSASDVKGAGTGQATPAVVAGGMNTAVSTTADTTVQAKYAETGGASTTGGPWLVHIEYAVY